MPPLRLLPDLEAALRRLPGVRAVAVVTAADASPTEVHVLAAPGKPAKQIVRDVQSLALAASGVEVDHRIVSVVQIGDDEPAAAGPPVGSVPPRQPGIARSAVSVTSVSVRTTSRDVEVAVAYAVPGGAAEGKAAGPVGAAHRARVVAGAALAGLADLLPGPADVDAAVLLPLGERVAAVCVITVAEPDGSLRAVAGCSLVRTDEAAAVVDAVLDAALGAAG